MHHGILNIYKERGMTSFQVVAKLRRITGQKKIGHTGTLDPDAVGVLPVCLGRATKVVELLTDKEKTYEAGLLLGVETDTQDLTGEVLDKKPVKDLQEEQVEKAILSFVGEYDQIPPMYSAVRINGKKLYELARKGQEIERKPRHVHILSIRIKKMELPRVTMEVTCSKGTYIRTLCHDIGQMLGCGGCMESLVRTKVAPFCLEESLTLQEVEEAFQSGNFEGILLPIDRLFDCYPPVTVKAASRGTAGNGGELTQEDVTAEELLVDRQTVRLYDENGQFLALYQWREKRKQFRIVKMFFPDGLDY